MREKLEEKTEVVLTRDQLNREKNQVKARFMPRNGSLLRLQNGIIFKVVFSNVGQLRFTAMFDSVVSFKGEAPLAADPLPEEVATA